MVEMIDFLSVVTSLQQGLLLPQRIPLAMAALLLVSVAGVVTGPLFGNAVPFFWFLTDKILGGFGGRLDRVQRGQRDLMLRGLFLSLLGLVLFLMAGRGAVTLVQAIPLGGLTEILLLSLVLSAGTVWFALLRLFFALRDRKTGKNAYATIAATTQTNLASSDDYTLTRVGMGMAARGFDKGVVAPILWFLIGGLPAAYIYAGVAALKWRFGKDGFTKGFGKIPLLLEWFMGFLPTVLAGFLMALAGLLTPTGGMTRAFAGLMRKDGHAAYAEGGLPVTAMANALDVSLGGPTIDLRGSAIKRGWVGPKGATAQLGAGHLRRALYIAIMAHLLLLAGMGGCLILVGRLFA